MRMEDMSLSGLDNSKLELQVDVIKYNAGLIALHYMGGRPEITNKLEWRRARQRLPKKEALAHDIYTDLVEDTCLGLSFEIHRAVKCGYFLLDETDPESMKDFEIIDQPGVDIFGQVYNQWKSKECVCPNCNRSIAASRFAPHLEKCLGMGRNSSRIANRRIASSNNMNKSESDQEDNDDVNDNDWSYGSEKKGAFSQSGAKKRKSEKNPNSPRRSKSIKHKNGDLSVNTDPFKYSSSSGISYENLGPEELHTLLTTQCGVISEHTKKMCTRSLRCPQHTDDQRRSVRVYLLGSSASLPEPDGSTDNDSFDVVEGQGLMGRLPWDGSSDISPSDSASSKASTNNSDTRKPKKKKPSHISMGSAGGGGASKKKKPKAPAPHTPGMYSELN